MKEMTGECKFCHQTKVIAVTEATEQAGADELVTMDCGCEAAREYRKKLQEIEMIKAAKLSAKGTIYELFHAEYPRVEQLMCACIDSLCDKEFESVSVKVNNKVTAKITFSGGKIKVNRTDKNVYQRETEV